FCHACLAEMFGGHYCQACKQATIRELQAPRASNTPAVVMAARIYDGVSGAIHLVSTAASLSMLLRSAGSGPGTTRWAVLSWVLSGWGALLGLALLTGLFVVRPGRGWTWAYQVVLLAVSCLSWQFPFAIALLIFWLRPETRTYLRGAGAAPVA